MARVSEVAHITRSVDGVGVPDPDDPRSLEAATRLIWTRVHALETEAPGRPYKRNGVPGHLWAGSLTGVINDLWPELNARNLISAEKAQEIRKALHRYVTTSGVMACLDAGKRRATKPTWWISDYCNPVVVIQPMVVDTPLGEPAPPAVAAVPTPAAAEQRVFPCRYQDEDGVPCGHAPFTLVRIRARHEQAIHGVVYQADGSAVHFNPVAGISEEEIRNVIVQVAREAGGMVTATTAFKDGKRIDPRVTKLNVRAVLTTMKTEGLIIDDPDRTTTRCEYFQLVDKSQEESATVTVAAPQCPPEPAEHLVQQLDTAQEVLGLVFDDLKKVIARDFSGVHMDALSELREENTALKEELRVVTGERDAACAQLNTIKQMFGGT